MGKFGYADGTGPSGLFCMGKANMTAVDINIMGKMDVLHAASQQHPRVAVHYDGSQASMDQ